MKTWGPTALARVVEAAEQLRDRRLARAGVADERHRRARRDVEVDPVQDLGQVAVAEADVLEADMTLDPAEVAGARPVAYLGLLLEDVHDLVQRGHGGEERVVELRE